MRPVEVVGLVNETWENSLPNKRLHQLQVVRRQVPAEHLELFDSLTDTKLAGTKDDPSATVVILIHGIQTDGAWHSLVEKELSSLPHTNIQGLGYNFVSAFQLASPIRGAPIRKIAQDIRDARAMEPSAQFMVIAHSFGTYILSRMLATCPDIRFSRIIMCGCIIPTNYRWGLYTKEMERNSILNDVGTQDFYPIMATFSSFGYGSSGRKGFQTPVVKDRFFNYGHSDFFEPEQNHIAMYWKPFISEGKIVESDWDQMKPKLGVCVNLMSHPWIGRTLFFGMLVAGGFLLVGALS